MSNPGNPADLPHHDVPGEEWFASDAPEAADAHVGPVSFETATSARPASTGIKWFVGLIIAIFAVGIIALIIAMFGAVGR